MKAVRPLTALTAAAVVMLVTGLLMLVTRNSGHALPRHSWWEVLLVLVLAAAVTAGGWRVRDQVRTRTRAKQEAEAARRSGREETQARAAAAGVMRGHEGVASDTARRVVVLAQAAALGGAMLGGWYAGQMAVHLARLHVDSSRSASVILAVLTVSGALLSVAGFVVQRWCTIPDDER